MTMNKRNCPVCGSNRADVIMRFTPELLAEVNPTYRLEILKEAVKGKEKRQYVYVKSCQQDRILIHKNHYRKRVGNQGICRKAEIENDSRRNGK